MASQSTSTSSDGSRTLTIQTDGETRTITTDAYGNPTHISTVPTGAGTGSVGVEGGQAFRGEEQMPPMAAFVLGVMLGALLLWAFQFWGRRAARRAAAAPPEPDQVAGELAALRRRTAVLERIATDPAIRVEREIEALR